MFGGFGRGPGPAPAGGGPSPSPCFFVAGLSPPHPPLRVREVWRFFPPAPCPQGGGKKERFVPCARGWGVSGRWFGWFQTVSCVVRQGMTRFAILCY